jgi:transcription elongation factor Elf1
LTNDITFDIICCKGGILVEVKLKKQAEIYLAKCDNTDDSHILVTKISPRGDAYK